MMEARKTIGDLPLLSYIPPARLASIFLIFSGLFLAFAPQFARNKEAVGPIALAAVLICGLSLSYLGIVVGNTYKRLDLYYRRSSNALLTVEKGWFSRKIKGEEFPAREIEAIEIQRKRDSDGDDLYSLVLLTKSGKTVQLIEQSFCREELVKKKHLLLECIESGGTNLHSAAQRMDPAKVYTRNLVLFTCLVVTAVPIIAHMAGQISDHPSLKIKAGIPDEQNLNLLRTLAGSILKDEEKILWVCQPEVGHESSLKMWFTVPFAIVWTLFSFAWTGLAFYEAWQKRNPAAYFLVLFGLPFVFIGLGLLLIPYFAHERELNTVYLLTDRAALCISKTNSTRLCEYNEPDFGPIEVTPYKPGYCDLLFIKDSSQGDKYPYGGFYGVTKVDLAIRILKGAYQNNSEYRSLKAKHQKLTESN